MHQSVLWLKLSHLYCVIHAVRSDSKVQQCFS
ncbi:Uncharacterised protein [Vibrio cholerae]|nr:Uncharacterised protein [Vibrio cholerae]